MAKSTNPDIFQPIDVPDNIRQYVRRALVAETNEPVDMEIDVRATGYHYLGWVWRGRWQCEVNGDTIFDSNTDGRLALTGQVKKNVVTSRMQHDIGQVFLEFTALGHFQLLGINGMHTACAIPVLNPALSPHFERVFEAEN